MLLLRHRGAAEVDTDSRDSRVCWLPKSSKGSMKRARSAEDGSASEDDAFDDGDDLMARAADMMDFDDEDEDSGSDSSGESGTAQEAQPVKKKQKSNGRKKSRSPSPGALQEDVEAVNVLQLQVGRYIVDGSKAGH
jgi:hypothetical protein